MSQRISKFLKNIKFNLFSLIVISLSALILFSFMYGNVKQETYELKLFQIAPDAIRSIKTVEDTVKTEQEKARAASEVTPYYQFSSDVAKNRQAIVTSMFDFLVAVKTEGAGKALKPDSPQSDIQKAIDEMHKNLASFQENEPELYLNDEAITHLIMENVETMQKVQKLLAKIVGEELDKPVRTADLTIVRYDVERKILLSEVVPTAIEQTVIMLGRSLIIETETINEGLTGTKVEEARASVDPIRILQGQVIVREGQVIDTEIYRQLELAGLLTDQASLKPIAGLILFIVFITSIIFIHFTMWQENPTTKKKFLSIVLVVFLGLVVIMKLITLIEQDFDLLIAFLFPTALASLLVRLLTNERLALMTTIITAATAGVLLQDGYAAVIQMEIALYILFGGMMSLYFLGNIGRRSSILRTSLGVSVSNMMFIAFYLLMTQSSYSLQELTFYAVAAITSGILSGALTIGLMPFFETAFGLLSDMRLVELSNPNHPLFKKILIETPGTYHHSVMVANLADAACESIGANGLLARVGCYYHDIGKTVRPSYFIENQHPGQNPHDKISTKKSRDIIIAHAEDGAKILEQHKMPPEIVDIARQHHGTSLLKFFLVKAQELGEDVVEEEYRYKGPKPQTKEIAVISIADSVEAAVRSMNEPTSEKIAALVRSIVNTKLNDGQFDECDLSMKELKKVEQVICETLNGIFHNRIEYPD